MSDLVHFVACQDSLFLWLLSSSFLQSSLSLHICLLRFQENNAVVKEVGNMRAEENLKTHVDLVQSSRIVNLEDAQKIAGSRAYYLINEGPLLNQALISYALQFASQRGFTPIHTPFFMVRDVMAECAQLSQFDEELYKVTGEGDDKYLIATSEQPLCALHRKKWFNKEELPLKYVGYSTCFRKEAGSRSDTLGIFRYVE